MKFLRLFLVISISYLITAFIFTLADLKPWEPSHAHNMFGGWKGMIFFPVWTVVDFYFNLIEPEKRLSSAWFLPMIGFLICFVSLSFFLLRAWNRRLKRKLN